MNLSTSSGGVNMNASPLVMTTREQGQVAFNFHMNGVNLTEDQQMLALRMRDYNRSLFFSILSNSSYEPKYNSLGDLESSIRKFCDYYGYSDIDVDVMSRRELVVYFLIFKDGTMYIGSTENPERFRTYLYKSEIRDKLIKEDTCKRLFFYFDGLDRAAVREIEFSCIKFFKTENPEYGYNQKSN